MKKLLLLAIVVATIASCKKEAIQNSANPEKMDMDLTALKQRVSNNTVDRSCNSVAPQGVGLSYLPGSTKDNLTELLNLDGSYKYYDPTATLPKIILMTVNWKEGRKTKIHSYGFWVTSLSDPNELSIVRATNVPVPAHAPFTVSMYGFSLCSITSYSVSITLPAQSQNIKTMMDKANGIVTKPAAFSAEEFNSNY